MRCAVMVMISMATEYIRSSGIILLQGSHRRSTSVLRTSRFPKRCGRVAQQGSKHNSPQDPEPHTQNHHSGPCFWCLASLTNAGKGIHNPGGKSSPPLQRPKLSIRLPSAAFRVEGRKAGGFGASGEDKPRLSPQSSHMSILYSNVSQNSMSYGFV